MAVLRLEQGDFGFLDMFGARLRGTQKLTCEMTLRDGRIVYELNGLSRPELGRRCPRAIGPRAISRWDWNREPAAWRTVASPSSRPPASSPVDKDLADCDLAPFCGPHHRNFGGFQ